MPRGLRAPARLVLSALIGRVRMPEPVIAMVGRRMGGNASLPYRWNPDYPARVGVLPRAGGADDVRWFDVEPCYVFHAFNAYDDGDTIIADVVRHPKMFASDFHGPNEGPTTLDRWVIDLADGKVRETRLNDHPQEFPRADDRLVGRHYRYGYAMQTCPTGPLPLSFPRQGDISGLAGRHKHRYVSMSGEGVWWRLPSPVSAASGQRDPEQLRE